MNLSQEPGPNTTPHHVLEQVRRDNVRANQIGGHRDGIIPDVAEDLGFMAGIDEIVHGVADRVVEGPADRISKATKPTSKLFELPGIGMGRVNFDKPVRPADAQKGLGQAEIDRQNAINEAGSLGARAALGSIKPPPNI